MTPSQLSDRKPFSRRNFKDNIMKGKQVSECKDLKAFTNKNNFLSPKKKRNTNILYIKSLEKDSVLCVLNNNTYNICRFNSNESNYNITIETRNILALECDSDRITSKKTFLNNEYYLNSPICVYSAGKVLKLFILDYCSRRIF